MQKWLLRMDFHTWSLQQTLNTAESSKTSEIKFVHEGFYVYTFTEDSFGMMFELDTPGTMCHTLPCSVANIYFSR